MFSIGKNGIGYVKSREITDIIEIPPHHTNTALNKDIVRVQITDPRNNIGEVIDIERRAKVGFTGILQKEGEEYILSPMDARDPHIIIPDDPLAESGRGKVVFVKITAFKENNRIEGRIEKVVGNPGTNDTEMQSLALEKGFDYEFPRTVNEEAEVLQERDISTEVAKRKDMRSVTTFTIDPADAKDFDDALSFRTLENGNYEIGVHIADVSHYVTPGSAIDDEAKERTTSVYLVDRTTIPMLPEGISNDLCSLNPEEDKLTFSAVFEVDSQTGAVITEWFGRTVIHSDKRFTYEEAQEVIDEKEGVFAKELLELNRLAKIYEQKRFEKGALNFETDEVKFILDEKGHPIAVRVKERIDTNKLIEEFMLLANSRVAKFMSTRDTPFVYRIHDKPEPEKMEFLGEFLSALGYTIEFKDKLIPSKILQHIVDEASDKDERDTINSMIIRSMQKAIYSTDNIGHYGLAFKHYTHFTSPIRRYPDVMVHRLLANVIEKKQEKVDRAWYEKMCQKSSEREKDATDAERNSIKYKQVEFMADRIGQIFTGVVTGVSKFGIFVAEEESRSEGMVHISDLGDEYFVYDDKKKVIRGEKTGTIFQIGVKLRVKVKEANLETKLINYGRVK